VEDKHLSCCLTFDFDAMSSWIGFFRTNNPSALSRGEFGAAVGLPRVLDLLKRHDIKATFCVPGHTAHAYPNLVAGIHDDGHEIAHHGWVHENPADFDADGERRNLERGIAAIEDAAGVSPVGYRSPAWDLSRHSLGILIEYGFLYDSSCMANDFYPYYPRIGDDWSQIEPYVFGRACPLVEMPVTWGLDDVPVFEHFPGMNGGLAAPSAVEEIWRGDFDFAHDNCPGGVYILTLHPEVIGRGHRMVMLERLIEYFKDKQGVRFESMGDFASRWREANPLESWIKENPVYVDPRGGAGRRRPSERSE